MQRTKKHSSIPREYPLPRLYTSVSTKEESLKVEADWHDYYELIYFQEGSFQLYLNLKEINIEEECLFLIPKGCVHRLYATSEKAVEHSLCFRLEDFCFSEEDILEQGFFRELRKEEHFFPKEISLSHLGFFGDGTGLFGNLQVVSSAREEGGVCFFQQFLSSGKTGGSHDG